MMADNVSEKATNNTEAKVFAVVEYDIVWFGFKFGLGFSVAAWIVLSASWWLAKACHWLAS